VQISIQIVTTVKLTANYKPDALSVAQPTVSKHWMKKYHIPWTCSSRAHSPLTTNSTWVLWALQPLATLWCQWYLCKWSLFFYLKLLRVTLIQLLLSVLCDAIGWAVVRESSLSKLTADILDIDCSWVQMIHTCVRFPVVSTTSAMIFCCSVIQFGLSFGTSWLVYAGCPVLLAVSQV